jgi:hypothetical protein
MKKNTKKKVWKVTKSMGKLLFVYPIQGVWWLGKKMFYGTKSKTEQVITARKRLKNEPTYGPFEEVHPVHGKFSSFENHLLRNKSTVGIILGARGTGKSAIGIRLLENFAVKTNKKIYALGFKEETLPEWIKVIYNIEEIENDSVLLIDEGGIEFSSRKTMSGANKLLSEILLISRHKDLSVLFITQNSSNLEINAIRQADYLLLKPSSLLQKDFERKKIKTIYDHAQEMFDQLKEKTGLTYIYAANYQGFVSNSLPSFWSEGISKGYGRR